MKSKSIAILSCYFGPLPWYFVYFTKSCAFNPGINFIIVTDNAAPANLPPNIKFVNLSLQAVKDLASKKLGFPVALSNPYKLCDYKPAYGLIFSALLKEYDFWGHGDIDIVYGHIRGFITNRMLDQFDIINSRHDYITGSFCLFRNNRKMNRLFMESRDYLEVFTSEEHFCFDECSFLWKELENGASVFEFPQSKQSMTYVVKKAAAEKRLKAYFDFLIVEGIPGNIRWHNGKIIFRDCYEAMFYHLVKFKKECKRPKILDPVPSSFHFTPRKIMSTLKSEIPSL